MSDHTPSLHDDVAYLRDLAHQGANAPMVGGSMLVLAGVVFSAASLVAWAIVRQFITAPLMWGNYVWLAAVALYFAGLFVLKGRINGSLGALATNNRAVAAVWRGVGNGIMVFMAALAAVCWKLHSPLPTAMIAPFVLAVYGIGWMVSAAMSPTKWIYAVAWASFAGAIVMGLLVDSPDLLLAYAAALVLLAALPGFVLMRQASRV